MMTFALQEYSLQFNLEQEWEDTRLQFDHSNGECVLAFCAIIGVMYLTGINHGINTRQIETAYRKRETLCIQIITFIKI